MPKSVLRFRRGLKSHFSFNYCQHPRGKQALKAFQFNLTEDAIQRTTQCLERPKLCKFVRQGSI